MKTKYLTLCLHHAAGMAACAQFQNPICTEPFCHSLPHAFSPLCARQICDVVNSHLLQIFRFDTIL